jgi:hypothetical protein
MARLRHPLVESFDHLGVGCHHAMALIDLDPILGLMDLQPPADQGALALSRIPPGLLAKNRPPAGCGRLVR